MGKSITRRSGDLWLSVSAKVIVYVCKISVSIVPLEICWISFRPINTYGEQGTNKYGVHATDHAIFYTDEPVAFDGETERGLTKTPIRMVPYSPRHKLSKSSRLNYAKLYTVECNVKVWFIGKIHHNSEHQLSADYNVVHPPIEYHSEPPTITPEETSSYIWNATTYEGQSPNYPATTGSYHTGTASYPSTSSVTGTAYPDSTSCQPNHPIYTTGQSSYPAASTTYPFSNTDYATVTSSAYPAGSSYRPVVITSYSAGIEQENAYASTSHTFQSQEHEQTQPRQQEYDNQDDL